jgi:hypothetical protein
MVKVTDAEGGPGVALARAVTVTAKTPWVPAGIARLVLVMGPVTTVATSTVPDTKSSR